MKEIFRRQIKKGKYYYLKSYDYYGFGYTGYYLKVEHRDSDYMLCRVYKECYDGKNTNNPEGEKSFDIKHLDQIFELSEHEIYMHILMETI